jgi:hypothetical protein
MRIPIPQNFKMAFLPPSVNIGDILAGDGYTPVRGYF